VEDRQTDVRRMERTAKCIADPLGETGWLTAVATMTFGRKAVEGKNILRHVPYGISLFY
jgi:hypothetical protein